MSLKSSGHGGFKSKYHREGEAFRFVPWVFFFFFGGWWLRLWLGVVAMAVVRGDELEKLRPWRF